MLDLPLRLGRPLLEMPLTEALAPPVIFFRSAAVSLRDLVVFLSGMMLSLSWVLASRASAPTGDSQNYALI